MYFSVGDIVSADNQGNRIVGKITYRNTNDNRHWDEYRMISLADSSEWWLSIDDAYKEYSISRVVRRPNSEGMHRVDQGREVVESARASLQSAQDDLDELLRQAGSYAEAYAEAKRAVQELEDTLFEQE